jgi:hypothetical protein
MKSKLLGCLAAALLGGAIALPMPAIAQRGGGMHFGGGGFGGCMHFGGGGFGGGMRFSAFVHLMEVATGETGLSGAAVGPAVRNDRADIPQKFNGGGNRGFE